MMAKKRKSVKKAAKAKPKVKAKVKAKSKSKAKAKLAPRRPLPEQVLASLRALVDHAELHQGRRDDPKVAAARELINASEKT
jgi:hypothetical protein